MASHLRHSPHRMPKRKAVLITNPGAGGQGARRASNISRFSETLTREGVDLEITETAGPFDARRLADLAVRQGATDLIIHGGDGTVNEALQGLGGAAIRLAIWPGGTANVLAKELGMPAVAETAARIIAGGSTRQVHIGRAFNEATGEERYFLLMAGIGLDASVVSAVRPWMKRLIGKAAFWYSGLGHLAHWNPEQFEIQLPGKKLRGTFAAVGNGSRYGGNLAVTPRARLEDPEFEVCVIQSCSRLRFLHLLTYMLRNGVDEDREDVKFIRTRSLHVEGSAPVQVDGEVIGTLPMSFEIANWTLEVVVPPTAPLTAYLLPVNQASRSSRTALGESFTASSL
jgi:diacylglycerol kinase (ATP)